MRFFIDIDNTLTTGRAMWSEPNLEMIAKVEKLIEQGHEVIIWSTGGTGYARDFCAKHNLEPLLTIGKPDIIVDDHSRLHKSVISPEQFLIQHFGSPEAYQ